MYPTFTIRKIDEVDFGALLNIHQCVELNSLNNILFHNEYILGIVHNKGNIVTIYNM